MRPIHGAYYSGEEHGWIPISWKADGSWEDETHYLDIVWKKNVDRLKD